MAQLPDSSADDPLLLDTFAAVLASGRSGDGRAGLPERTFRDLDWDVVTRRIAARCHGADAASLAEELGLLPVGDVVLRRRHEIAEGMALLDAGDVPPATHSDSIAVPLLRARKHDVLASDDLIGIARAAEAATLMRSWWVRRSARASRMSAQASRIADVQEVSRAILPAFDPAGRLRDDASPDLGPLRRRVQRLREGILARLERIVRSPRFEGILQDDYITIRDERYVLPVRAGERGDFPGIVHGQSGSGATLFVEPQELIEANNQFRVAQLDVENEERRILQGFTELVLRHADALDLNRDILTYLDLSCAVARLGVDLRMTMPRTSGTDAGQGLDLRAARHPVLALRALDEDGEVIPNDIRLAEGTRVLVVSGPNTGGKTVTLKTVGLYALMTRAGMPLPCDEDSICPVFEQVFTDIGDEQTVERDLSTFSGHVANIASFYHRCSPGTLVLLDELFAGTDPEQGAALGRALLEEFADRDVWCVITTHLESLKTLSFEDDRFACASVGFDVEALRPTWRLRMGVPGASYALRIAERIGLAPRIVERAEAVMGQGPEVDREQVIAALEEEHRRTREIREALDVERRDLQRRLAEAEAERDRVRRKREDLVRQQSTALLGEVGALRDELREKARLLREAPAPDSTEARAEAHAQLEEARRIARRVEQRVREARTPEPRGAEGRPSLDETALAPGMTVWVAGFERVGTVVEVPADPQRIPVQLGAIRATVPLTDLYRDESAAKAAQTSQSRAPARFRERPPDRTLDLRGARVDDAIEALEARIEAALATGVDALLVIHGHGTGALKRAVRGHLAHLAGVLDQRPGEREEGGDGVTVVELET
ncbi:MAG: hypothetical protein EA398_08500 [Deltaproteobacteria bacterium]|nr:MAG: hypothetical protein EA398_08500 [Deltaproteobacteria bacterium]